MRKVVVSEYVTLDGSMEEPGTWSFPFWSDELAQFKYGELFAADAMLLGRITYEGFAAAWPTMEGTGEFGERMNSMPKYVATRTLKDLTWNASRIEGDIPAAVAKLKEQPGQDILVAGSGQLVHTLMQNNLVDEYRLLLHPFILGHGKPLFREGLDTRTLTLVDAKPTSMGVLILTYHPAEGS